MKTYLVTLISMLSLFVSCVNEDDATEILLFVTASDNVVNSGEIVRFDIQARTLNHSITKLEIRSFDRVAGNVLLYEKNIDSQSHSESYVYTAPHIVSDSLEVTVSIRVTDNLGHENIRNNTLIVRQTDLPLTELSGITLYSPHSGKVDGFSFATLQPLKCSTTPEESIDFYICTDEVTATETLSRTWKTHTGLRFAKAPQFDYPSATQNALSTVYEHSVTQNYVSDLQVDDIILMGDEKGAVGVIKIISIFDESGCENDRYLINLKLLPGNTGDPAPVPDLN